ncbi:MAG: PilZ domain-containing protein [Cyanobacteria bacterium HKST-UBA06]|nr:PilZ domain-containing protein [Cyanobacteria bacterium HKST-UBA06]
MVHIADFVEIDDPIRLYVPQTVAGPPMTFDCKVKYVLKSTVLLQFPIEQADLAQSVVTAGMELESEFLKRGNEHALRMPTTVKAFKREKNTASALVEIPFDFKEYFRRRHVRIPARFPVRVTFFYQGEQKNLQGQSINMSGGGMRLTVYNHVFAIRDQITLSFQPDTKQDKKFTLPARVVFSRQDKDKKDECVIAVEYIDIPQGVEDQLVGICFQFDVKRAN